MKNLTQGRESGLLPTLNCSGRRFRRGACSLLALVQVLSAHSGRAHLYKQVRGKCECEMVDRGHLRGSLLMLHCVDSTHTSGLRLLMQDG